MFVHARERELFVQGEEAEQMIFHATARVVGTRPGAQDERPVAGLREEQFAGGLFQGAGLQASGVRKLFGEFSHPVLRDLQVRINPFVRFVQPHAPVAFLAPA